MVRILLPPAESRANFKRVPAADLADPILGSGTTLIATEMSGRVCSGVELDPAYADVTVRRWQRFAGRGTKARLTG